MKTLLFASLAATAAAGALLVAPSQSKAFWNQCCTPETYYSHPEYGRPLTVLLAPTVHKQINYQWGVPGVRVDRTSSQFQRGAPCCPGCGSTQTPPYWPTSTTQLGTYYMRVPW
jgi:hypothetical protein